MTVVETVEKINAQTGKETAKYRVTFLRGRRNGSHIEILEIVEAQDSEEAVNKALEIAKTARWHIERIERVITSS